MAISPERFVHPRQNYLWERLQKPLPEGAQVLIEEAIEEYQEAFTKKPTIKRGSERINSAVAIQFPDDGDGNILAGSNKLLEVRFGSGGLNDERVLGDTFAHLAVMLKGTNLDEMQIYPDWLRYVAIDSTGNSKRTAFLLEIPSSLKGYDGKLEVVTLNGPYIMAQQTLSLSIR